MANMKAIIVLSMLYLVAGDNKSPPIGPTGGNLPPASPPTGSPTPPTAKPTTTANTTTTTTTTTTPKTTTTSTTTLTPSTTTAPNTTTTTITTTTTTVKPTTTPPPLSPGKWIANYTGTNRTCLLLEAALQIELMVAGVNKSYTVNVPSTAQAEGICGDKAENITIKFGDKSVIKFDFSKSNDSKKYDLEMVMVSLQMIIPGTNITGFVLANQTTEFSTPLGNSYKCAPERTMALPAVDKAMNYTGKLHISHFQVQAFRNSTNQKFDEALDCQGSETPDVVPIAVGLALVTLVIIVLIAYLIGRRRSQARGYLSMFPQNRREEDYIPMKNLSCFN